MPFALFFATTALAQVLLSVVNAKIVERFRPRSLIGFGLTLASLAVAALAVGVFALDTPLPLTCAGFLILMAVQALHLRQRQRPGRWPGSARRRCRLPPVLGVVQAVAMATAAPLASSGGSVTAVPMILGHDRRRRRLDFAYLVIARPSAVRALESSPTE